MEAPDQWSWSGKLVALGQEPFGCAENGVLRPCHCYEVELGECQAARASWAADVRLVALKSAAGAWHSLPDEHDLGGTDGFFKAIAGASNRRIWKALTPNARSLVGKKPRQWDGRAF
jgi:hypothetical protein